MSPPCEKGIATLRRDSDDADHVKYKLPHIHFPAHRCDVPSENPYLQEKITREKRQSLDRQIA